MKKIGYLFGLVSARAGLLCAVPRHHVPAGHAVVGRLVLVQRGVRGVVRAGPWSLREHNIM